jgi:hypothetical protein
MGSPSTELLKGRVLQYLFTSSTGVYYPYLKRGLDEATMPHTTMVDPKDPRNVAPSPASSSRRKSRQSAGGLEAQVEGRGNVVGVTHGFSARPRLIAVAFLFAACASVTWDRPGTGGRRLPLDDERCFQPLRAYCRGSQCPTYEDGLRAMHKGLKGPLPDLRTRSLRRTPLHRDGGWTDASSSFSRCQFWTHYGTPLTCKTVAVEKLR